MKAFTFDKPDFRYPDFRYPSDMETIWEYLAEKGTLNVSAERVEELYADFSVDMYCAGWMNVTRERLEQFAFWLSRQDI